MRSATGLAHARPCKATAVAPGVLKWVSGVAILLTAIVVGGSAVYGSFDAALARLRGEAISVSPTVLGLGHGKPSDLLTGTVTVTNLADEPLRLIGGKADCSCLVTQKLPLTIVGRGRADIPVILRIPPGASAGQFERTAVIFTDREDQPRIDLKVVCRVDR